MNPKRVLYLINNLGSGGAQRQLLELVSNLDREEVDPLICMYHPLNFFEGNPRYGEIPIVTLPKKHSLDGRIVFHLAKLLRREKIDILHNYLLLPGAWGMLAALASRQTKVICCEQSDTACGPRLWHVLRRWTYPYADLVIANSDRAADGIKERFGMPDEKVATIYNGIDIDHWKTESAPDPKVEALVSAAPANAIRVAVVGGYHRWKDHATLVRAMERVGKEANIAALCAGATVHEDVAATLTADIERLGLENRIIRSTPLQDVRALYHRVDALVLTSLFEGFPNVVLEAMAAGLPVIASDVSDLKKLITPGKEGWVFPVGDDEALAGFLAEFAARSPEQRSEMGRAAFAFASKFTVQRMVDDTLACYDRLMP